MRNVMACCAALVAALVAALIAPLIAAMAGTAAAGTVPARPVVAELFTSEGCSSCPPAEALMAALAARDPGVLVLAYHVTYWDRLGWPDRYGLPQATARQRTYAARLGLDAVYTPQLVVDGARDVVGSDGSAVRAALAAAAAERVRAVALTLARTAQGVSVTLPAADGRGELLLVGYDTRHATPVARGENAGRVLIEANVVRSIRSLGAWRGMAWQVQAAAPPGEHLAALLQSADGRIIGAATAP